MNKRYDALTNELTGIGTNRDRLTTIRPNATVVGNELAEQWYFSSGMLQNIVDIPAEDSTREWINIETNKDDLNVSRLIQNRLTELDVQKRLMELVKLSRIYNNGSFIFYGIESNLPQIDLANPIPLEVYSIEYINVFSPSRVQITEHDLNPLSIDYNKPRITISGQIVHDSRFDWLVRSYIKEFTSGVSVIQTILDAIKAQDIGLWTVTNMLLELTTKVFKSPKVATDDPRIIAEFLSNMRAVMSSQSSVALGNDEELMRITSTSGVTSIKEMFDFIFENLAGIARIPKSRLMGQSQGTLTSSSFDLINYYDGIAKFQENELKPIIEKIISLVVREKRGKVYQALKGNINSLDWEFTFNSLWKPLPVEQADIALKTAQKNQIYLTTAVLSPDEVRKIEFESLEEFTNVNEDVIDFGLPEIESQPEVI